MKTLPKARTDNIVVQNLPDETLIYNLTTHQAFTLNETLKIVYQACGNGLTFEELQRKHRFTDDLIYLALDELKENNLLENTDYTSSLTNLSRREAIRKVGLVSMITLPIISGLAAPSSVDAASRSTCTGTCIPAGSDICAGANGQDVTVITYESSNGSCTGAVTGSTLIICRFGATATTPRDVCRP